MNISDDDNFSFEDDIENILSLHSQNYISGIRPFSHQNEPDNLINHETLSNQNIKTINARISSSNI